VKGETRTISQRNPSEKTIQQKLKPGEKRDPGRKKKSKQGELERVEAIREGGNHKG